MDGATMPGIVHGVHLDGMAGDGVMAAFTTLGSAMDGLETVGTVMDLLRSMEIITVILTETGDIPISDFGITPTDILVEGADSLLILKIPEVADTHRQPMAQHIV
jgi:hypothetical protein